MQIIMNNVPNLFYTWRDMQTPLRASVAFCMQHVHAHMQLQHAQWIIARAHVCNVFFQSPCKRFDLGRSLC